MIEVGMKRTEILYKSAIKYFFGFCFYNNYYLGKIFEKELL